jgi:hypothetical protein
LQPCCDFFAKNANWVSGITEEGKLLDRVEPQVGKTKLVCPRRHRRQELQPSGLFAEHFSALYSSAGDLQ